MVVKFRNLILTALFAIGCGCPTSPVSNGTGGGREQKPNAAVTPAEPTGARVRALESPTAAYKAFHEYCRRRDIEKLRTVLSGEMIEFFSMMGQAQNRSLDDELMILAEKPAARVPETRNERIEGDRGFIEYRDETGRWREMDFIRENGEWKLTLPRAKPSR